MLGGGVGASAKDELEDNELVYRAEGVNPTLWKRGTAKAVPEIHYTAKLW